MTHEARLALIMLPFPVVHICGSAKSWTGAAMKRPEESWHMQRRVTEGAQDYLYWFADDTTYGGMGGR